jgi:hypothetical protein
MIIQSVYMTNFVLALMCGILKLLYHRGDTLSHLSLCINENIMFFRVLITRQTAAADPLYARITVY